jgi:hypothetical protein
MFADDCGVGLNRFPDGSIEFKNRHLDGSSMDS